MIMDSTEAGLTAANKGKPIVAVTTVFTVTALLIIALRLFTRLKIVRNTGIDDAVIIFAMVCPFLHVRHFQVEKLS